MRLVLPQNIEPFARQQSKQELKCAQLEEYVESLSIEGSGATGDNVETIRKPAILQQVSSPTHLRTLDMPKQHEEHKVDFKYKSSLQMAEQHHATYDEYIMKTSALSTQMSTQHGENSQIARIHASKVDPKAPAFKVLSCHSLVKINFCL